MNNFLYIASMEIWKDIPGYENVYQVSSFGRVKSLKWGKIRILKNFPSGIGYLAVSLSTSSKLKRFYIHQLVAMAFFNHEPNGHGAVVDHINGNKEDNRLENLQIISQRENLSKPNNRRKTSKYVGVSFNRGRWESHFYFAGKQKYLGSFRTELGAYLAYINAKEKYLI